MCRLPDVMDHRQIQKLSTEGYFTFLAIRYTQERQRHRPDNRAGANHHHHHWAAVVSRGWANASACLLQVSLSCAVLYQIVSLQYLSRSSLHRLAGVPCHLFLSSGLQVVTRVVHLSSLRWLMGPFHCSHIADYI